jgi:heme oxygenase
MAASDIAPHAVSAIAVDFPRTSPADSPLARVRVATAARHARLDAQLPIARAGAGMREYRAHLRLLRDWLLPMHAWTQGFLDGPQDPARLARSERLRWLRCDLEELGESASPAGPSEDWPAQAGAAWRWGAAYVVEGSQLGARVLLKALAPRLGDHRPRLLDGGGADAVSARWRAFRAAFERALASDADVDEACAGAREAFDRILALAEARA